MNHKKIIQRSRFTRVAIGVGNQVQNFHMKRKSHINVRFLLPSRAKVSAQKKTSLKLDNLQ